MIVPTARAVRVCTRTASACARGSRRLDRQGVSEIAEGPGPATSTVAVTVAGSAASADAALARIWSLASASVNATCMAPTPESPWVAASLATSPQRPTTIASPEKRDRSRRTW